MIIIAHRGACMEALENSFAAFDLALAQGAQRFEFDVQLTKDGQACVIHDADLRRTAQQRGRIARMSRAEIKKVKLNNGEPVPFLDEVIAKYKRKVEFNIELKGTDPAIADAVAVVLQQHQDVWSDIIISSFKHRPLERSHELIPQIQLACLWGPDIEWPFLGNSSPMRFMNKVNAKIIHPWVGYVNDKLMQWAKEYNWKVYAYADRGSENDNPTALWQRLKDSQIDGLCTNWPKKFHDWQQGIAS